MRSRSNRKIPPSRRLKIFRSITWRDGIIVQSTDEFIAHILTELGRLEMELADIESHARPPNTRTILSDLLAWLSSQPSKAYAELVSWKTLDFDQLRDRLRRDYNARPRIEISAEITKMNNLSVRWHPGGWRDSEFNWDRANYNFSNLITHRTWKQPPDFHWFSGDEQPTFEGRPSNELMYIRGVGNLRPEPETDYGPYASYNRDVLDSILICAVRSAYETLLKQLEYSFDVTVINAFDFAIREEVDESDQWSLRYPIRRVIAWSLEDAAELQERRDKEAAIERERRDRDELANVVGNYGFSLTALIDALLRAASSKRTGPAPSGEHVNRNTAKEMRSAGFQVDARDVRRIRELIERYNPEILPEVLQPAPPAVKAALELQDNVVRFPKNENS